jgi:indolepyruvate ferredoxin oxidoreductase
MAYKDEYEVARLYTTASFADKLKQQFEGKLKLRFNLAPPLFAKKDAHGYPLKSEYGGWVWPLLHLLARGKSLRGTNFDPFGWTEERRLERQLIVDYRALITSLLKTLDAHRLPQAVEIAALAEKIRGFGHVKMQAIKRYQADLESALQRLENGQLSIDQRKKQKGERYLMADGSSVTTPHTVQYASTL